MTMLGGRGEEVLTDGRAGEAVVMARPSVCSKVNMKMLEVYPLVPEWGGKGGGKGRGEFAELNLHSQNLRHCKQ